MPHHLTALNRYLSCLASRRRPGRREKVALRLEKALQRLRRSRGEAIRRVGVALLNPDPEVRYRALWPLGQFRRSDVVDILAGLLADPDGAVRYDAAMALGRTRHPGAVAPLVRVLVQPDAFDLAEAVESAAASALSRLGPVALPAVLPLTTRAEPEVRTRATYVLASVPGEEVRQTLEQLSRDENESVRAAAVDALESRSWLMNSK